MDELKQITPMGAEWRPWLSWYPPPLLIQWIRKGWERPVTGFPWDLSPFANAAGLYWRLTGIAKQQLEGPLADDYIRGFSGPR